jgi:hypothetical protein
MMGAWGTSLYAHDTAADLRDDFKEVARAPWDGARLLAWALERYPSATTPTDEDYPIVRLVLADLFWLYAIDHPPTIEAGRRIIAEGQDLAAMRALGMSEQDLKRRASMLAGLAVKWRTPNPRPRPRRILAQPEPFVLEVGDCLTYPLRAGKPYNPYIGPSREARFYGGGWTPDGWGAACVLARWHQHDVFPRYLTAVLRYQAASQPTLADFPRLSIRSHRSASGRSKRGLRAASTSRQHLARMRVEIVGRLAVEPAAVAAEFPPARLATWSGTEFANYANVSGGLAQAVAVDDPLARYLA